MDGSESISLLGLPLQREQANTLIGLCEKAPFGKNMDTVIDEKVRNTWQIPPERITIKNPEWHNCIDKFVKSTVAEKLGCPNVPISAFLYKMLLYESGCHFLKHQDTEKEDGMFAT